MAFTLSKQDMPDKDKKYFEKALELDPDNTEAQRRHT
jgi:hypothetical protein